MTSWSSLDNIINEKASRSGLYRLLCRHGPTHLPVEPKEDALYSPFRAYEPGFVHIDVKHLPPIGGEQRRYLIVAIDRATRWVSVEVYPAKTAAHAKHFLKHLSQAAPFRIHILLTENGRATLRIPTRGERSPTGQPAFEALCAALEIDHQLTRPRRSQTNGMIERFKGRISEILATHHFNSTEELETTIHRYVWLYDHHLPQRALGHVPPIEALKRWYPERPDLFLKEPRNR